MTVARAIFVKEAREWVGTRWHHQASVKGVGCDCIGLVRGVAVNCNILTADWWQTQAMTFHGYGNRPSPDNKLLQGMSLFTQEISFWDAKPADIVIMEFEGEPHHVAILGNYAPSGMSIIHAYAPSRKVVECRLDDVWASRIVGSYHIPGVEQ